MVSTGELKNPVIVLSPAQEDRLKKARSSDMPVLSVTEKEYQRYLSNLEDWERQILDTTLHFYEVNLRLVGGLVMPVILEFAFEDGTSEVVRIPAEIWNKGDEKVSKVFNFNKIVSQVTLDPFLETADTDRNNNYWPQRREPTRFELFNDRKGNRQTENPMQRARRASEME